MLIYGCGGGNFGRQVRELGRGVRPLLHPWSVAEEREAGLFLSRLCFQHMCLPFRPFPY